jgi:hypothetical protein
MRAPNQRHLEDPATDAGHFLFRLGLAVLVMALPVASTFSRRLMFTLLPVGALMMIAGVMLATREPALRNLRRVLSAPASLAGLVLMVWIAASMFWTPFPASSGGRAFKTFATIALIVIVIAAMPRHTRTSNLYLPAFGIALAALVAIALALLRPLAHVPLELEANLPERAGLMLAILVWPALGALAVRQRMGIAGLLAAAIVGAAIAVESVVALLALGAGALAFGLALAGPVMAGRVLGALFALALLAAPALIFAADRLAPQALSAGLSIWADVLDSQGLRLVTGHGFDAAARGFLTGYLPPEGPRGALFVVWFDLGLIGALLGGFLLVRAFKYASLLPPPLSAFMIGGLTTIAVVAIGSPASYQLWMATIVCVAALCFSTTIRGQYRTSRPAAASAR